MNRASDIRAELQISPYGLGGAEATIGDAVSRTVVSVGSNATACITSVACIIERWEVGHRAVERTTVWLGAQTDYINATTQSNGRQHRCGWRFKLTA